MSGIDQFLKLISPNFTLYGVLLTFGFLSFKAFKIFWKNEKDLREENFSRVKDLLGSFRRKYIEKKVKDILTESMKVAYSNAFSSLLNDIYSTPKLVKNIDGKMVQELVLNEDELKEIIDQEALTKRKDELQKDAGKDVEGFFSAASGEELFSELDQLYEQKIALSRQYKRAFMTCGISSYSFLFLSIVLYLGILQILGKWPNWLLFLWCYSSIQALITGIISSVILELCRRDLIHRWEDLQFYDKV